MKKMLLCSFLLGAFNGIIANEPQKEPNKEQVLEQVAQIAVGLNHAFYIFKPEAESKEWTMFIKQVDELQSKINRSALMNEALLEEAIDLLKSAITNGFALQPVIELIAEQPDLSIIRSAHTNNAEIVVIAFDLVKNSPKPADWMNFVMRSVDHAQNILGDESLPNEWLSIISTFITSHMKHEGISPRMTVLLLDAESLN